MKNTKENKLSSIKIYQSFFKIVSNVYSFDVLNKIKGLVYIIWKLKNYVTILVQLKIDHFQSFNS